jgi:hypothetical protein
MSSLRTTPQPSTPARLFCAILRTRSAVPSHPLGQLFSSPTSMRPAVSRHSPTSAMACPVWLRYQSSWVSMMGSPMMPSPYQGRSDPAPRAGPPSSSHRVPARAKLESSTVPTPTRPTPSNIRRLVMVLRCIIVAPLFRWPGDCLVFRQDRRRPVLRVESGGQENLGWG